MELFVEIGKVQLNKDGEELCGDNISITRHNGSIMIVTADGLGSGVKANILSTLTVKMAATMLEKGAKIEDVIETMANTLPVCKVRQLAYSTLSILRIARDGGAYLVNVINGFMLFSPSLWCRRQFVQAVPLQPVSQGGRGNAIAFCYENLF